MGMFASVKCDAPLPDGFVPSPEFEWQTKDLGCCVAWYRITSNGRLICDDKGVAGAMGDVLTDAELENFHGLLTFYGLGLNDVFAWYREYAATFTHGRLESIKRTQFEEHV